jgi:hypothetical protein
MPSSGVHPDHTIRVSPAELIVDPFYESQFSCLDRYEFSGFHPGRARWSQDWHFLGLRFDVAEGDTLLGAFSRRCRIDASGLDRFRTRLSLSATVRVLVTLTVDGEEQRVIDAQGSGEFRELFGAFRGRLLEAIRFEFLALRPGRAVGMVEWTMLESTQGLRALELARPSYDPSWKGYLRESVAPGELRPAVGIYFGAEDLEALRRKARSPLYAAVMANLRSTAARCMSIEPERYIREVARYLYPFTRDSIYYVGDVPELYVGGTACALVGLVDGDEPCLRMAARIALSQSFCGSWDAWIDTIPETVWEDRGFPNFIVGVGCAMVLDWAGCMLTEQGREVVVKALADKALPRIQQSLMKHGYMWYSNQGVWDLYGAVISTVAIVSRWPHGDMFLDRTMELLNGIVDRYIAEDGGSFEGTSYQLHTMAFAMLAAEAYGRHRGKPASEAASASLSKSVSYLLTMASEGDHPGSTLPLADGGRVGSPMAAHCVALLLRLTGRRELEPLLALLLSKVEPDVSMRLDNPALLVFGPESLSGGRVVTPVFRILPDSGLLTSSRETPAGSVRVVLAGCGVKDAGHSHEDRGSLIVEAFGRSLLNEVGMIDYEIAEHVLLKDARYHCVACPGPLHALPRQVLPTPCAVVPSGTGDQARLEAEIDLAPAWGPAVRAASRSIWSPSPEEMLLTDSFALPEAGAVTVIFTTTGAIQADSGGWLVRVGDAWARILPRWEVSHHLVADNLYNAMREPCRVLMLEAPAAREHRLVTALRVGRDAGRAV